MKFTTGYIPQALQYFGATAFGTHYEPKCTLGTGKFGLVVDKRPESLLQMQIKGKRFAQEIEKFIKTGKNSFNRRMKKKMMKFGERMISKISK